MRTRNLVMAVMLSFVPAALVAQDGPATAEARIEAALAAAVEAGIPTSLLDSKIAEGKARGVAMERVAAAVEARLRGLTRAQEALMQASLESTTEGELSVASDALEAGVSETALVAISETAPQERRAVAIAVLADLVRLGHAPERAQAQVEAALARGPDALANLRADANARLQTRGAAGTAVQAEAGAQIQLGGDRRPRN